MKKYLKVVSFILATILFLCLLSACSKDIPANLDFTLQKFKSNDVCIRNFDMYYGESDKVGIGFLEKLYDEKNNKEIIKKVFSDIKYIEKKVGILIEEKVNVYVLDTLLDTGFYVGGKNVYTTIEEIENDMYREALIRACYNLTEPWIIHGLSDYVFGEKKDNAYLTDYYKSTDDMSILGLFGGRFYEEWNTEDEIKIAKDTASSLVKYLIENNSVEELISQNVDIDFKRDWLKSIGVDREYENRYEGEFKNLRYSKSRDYSMIIQSDTAEYNMIPIEDASTGAEIEKFIYKDQQGRSYILKYLKENAPENFSYVRKNEKPSYYFLSDPMLKNIRSYALENGYISLGNKAIDHLHEYSHILIWPLYNSFHWQHEGIAEYLSMVVCPENYFIEISFDEELVSKDLTEFPEYYLLALEYYINHDGSIKIDNIDRRLWSDGLAYATLNSEGNWVRGYMPIYEFYKHIGGVKKYEGNELSYIQAASFTAYLIDNYSLDIFLEFCKNGSGADGFKRIFGVAYSEVKENWLEYLNR
ncbi:hypothetical protein [Proteiniborus sp. MB09-C3]|uniref:hypothetical protein n=1 Tax=Proteiniborus sp. MB09-C3 TaxID=3050072 RepID=UPI0025579376|nr:hypothetical protein [Proteiniborus sp. MB09-C3]WIV11695.1 hypothetical protein QO263_16565 [Proteiniborus sp. MB09-C3]